MARKRVSNGKRKVPSSVSLTQDQNDWLNDNPDFVLSEFIREKLDKEIERRKTKVMSAGE